MPSALLINNSIVSPKMKSKYRHGAGEVVIDIYFISLFRYLFDYISIELFVDLHTYTQNIGTEHLERGI